MHEQTNLTMLVPKLNCAEENHSGMPIEYLCLNPTCVKNSRQLACFNCCQDMHRCHLSDINVLHNLLADVLKDTHSSVANAIASGISNCADLQALQLNVTQLLDFLAQKGRDQRIMDREMQMHLRDTLQYYGRRRQSIRTHLCHPTATKTPSTIIKPVLHFKQGEGYLLKSPFSISANSGELRTVFAYPSLSKFSQSVQCTLKIQNCGLSWLGVGFSIGEVAYEQTSPKHLLAISNGWINSYGRIEPSKIKFGKGSCLTIRWDKDTQFVEFISKSHRDIVRLEHRWNQSVHLCIVLYYRHSSVSLLA